ncbi:beta-galactosidase [Agromyces larvae]|uniref:Beta-galactosidase n=1 Tax=Agromyces larvae TaxID=2929802 RepID=A0ABY4BYV9_9MICO|nr:beta-galactosidase [Agromyces larvae]UOE43051.1 beta-galactosidase [Agromyces larvae]
MTAWPTPGISFGGDWNPEQWTHETVLEDLDLMCDAGVNLVTLGVFSWVRHEQRDGAFDFTWIDGLLDLTHERGIRVDLATPTASVPMWLHRLHPEILPQDEFGHPLAPGGRNGFCASSPVYREYALRLVDALAEHVAGHPAIAMWHVGNELGGGNARCHCAVSNDAFRRWTLDRYGSVEGVNEAWGMSFWGNRYSSIEEVTTPSGRTAHNPGQLLDFERFSSEALLDCYLAERAVLRRHTPDVPVTTNFMVGLGPDVVDYPRWAEHVDLVANDHYTYGPDPRRHQDLAFAGDRMRGLSHGGPWMLMEHAASAASWHRINRAKRPGELARHALAHVARGSDSVLFFQWRASRFGTEQFHSAMVPHSGADSRRFRDIRALGDQVGRLAEVAGTRVTGARVALLHDDEAGWALRSGLKPVNGAGYADTARAVHDALFDRAVTVDIVTPWHPLDDYDLVVVPGLFLVSDEHVARIAEFAGAGGTVVVTWFSGIVDEHNRVRLGGYPGAFRDLLGVRGEEFVPLDDGESFALDTGWRGTRWAEDLTVVDAEVVARAADGDLAGVPVVTRRAVPGGGTAWYVATDLDRSGLDALLDRLLTETGVEPVAHVSAGIEAVRRAGGGRSYLFLINHGDEPGWADATGTDLLTGECHDGRAVVPAGAVVVLRES